MASPEQSVLTDQILFDNLELYIKVLEKDEAEDHVLIPEPAKKQSFYTVNEWKQYTQQASMYQEAVKNKQLSDQTRKQIIIDLREWLIASLPSHEWIVSEDNKYAVAIQRSDWPMDPPKILIEKNPVLGNLPALKLQHVNPN